MENTLTKNEESLLLFLEHTAVDQWGWIDNVKKLNADELIILQRWNESGFVLSRRAIKELSLTYAVKLSDRAWEIAHLLRKEKALRHIPESFEDEKRSEEK